MGKPDRLPICLKQLWMVTLPDGARYEAGASYHLSEAHRASYVTEVASRMIGPDDEREEPIGDPAPVHVRAEFYQEINDLGGSYRVK